MEMIYSEIEKQINTKKITHKKNPTILQYNKHLKLIKSIRIHKTYIQTASRALFQFYNFITPVARAI